MVFSIQYPSSACGLLSKKQYAASAAIILMMKLLTDLCLECTLARTVQTFGSLVIHIGTSETERNDLAPVVANQMQFETLEFHESVVGYGIGEIGLQMLPDEEQVVVFEIAERTKLEHYQNRHNLTVREGCLAIATRLTIRGQKRLFVYLLIKFFAKFIHGTENFRNFVRNCRISLYKGCWEN